MSISTGGITRYFACAIAYMGYHHHVQRSKLPKTYQIWIVKIVFFLSFFKFLIMKNHLERVSPYHFLQNILIGTSNVWMYLIMMSRLSFQVNPHSVVCLDFKELLARSRHHIWNLSLQQRDSNPQPLSS